MLTKDMEEALREALSSGAINALTVLLDGWTDDNDLNRKTTEGLLALAIVMGQGIT